MISIIQIQQHFTKLIILKNLTKLYVSARLFIRSTTEALYILSFSRRLLSDSDPYIYIYLKLNSVIGHFFLKKGFGIELNWVNMDQGPMKEYTSFAWSHHDFILFSNITIISTTTNEKYNGLRFVFIAPFIFQSSLNKIKYGLGLKL